MAAISSIKIGAQRLHVRKEVEAEIASTNASGEPWARTHYGFTVYGEERAYSVTLTKAEALRFLEWPELGGMRAPAVRKLVERVASLNPNAGEIGAGMLAQLVHDAKRLLED